jgi:hypothetical protein
LKVAEIGLHRRHLMRLREALVELDLNVAVSMRQLPNDDSAGGVVRERLDESRGGLTAAIGSIDEALVELLNQSRLRVVA